MGEIGLRGKNPAHVNIVRGDWQIGPSLEQVDAASRWPVQVVSRETAGRVWRANLYGTRQTYGTVTELHLACGECGQSVLCLSPTTRGTSYRVTAADMSAGILRHLLLSHPDVVAS
jgi:hypothetical protein